MSFPDDYIGTTRIQAKSMTRQLFTTTYNRNSFFPKRIGHKEDDEGYVIYHNGEIDESQFTWVTKEYFESVYREPDKMTFGQAFEMMRRGLKVARKSWEEEEAFLYVDETTFTDIKFQIYFYRNSKIEVWIPNQDDILAGDWYIVTCSK